MDKGKDLKVIAHETAHQSSTKLIERYKGHSFMLICLTFWRHGLNGITNMK
ncbi:hypothetical protein [Thermaerobacillus caldiproteolyticus]|uniref:Uncharacterized protein n=1 Tax=Thermaerobacillus caldiproteolyticus TaxID=247480 RepID=A0A7V9Z7F4_9BACL|nr:hypothetical protein [Anoxybacillus caldiproteolyticus]MBA2875452.1 hypothetical protein [Anoxybacillus caldiproteolyticus]